MFFNKRQVFISLLIISVAMQVIAAPLQIVTVSTDFASIAKYIGGKHVQVTSLINGSHDLHHINPKPSMVLKLRHADLLIRVGMSQDSWVDSLIQTARNPKVFKHSPGYLDASINIPKLDVPTANVHKGHGDVHKDGNPHYWLSPKNGRLIAQAIANKLIKIATP